MIRKRVNLVSRTISYVRKIEHYIKLQRDQDILIHLSGNWKPDLFAARANHYQNVYKHQAHPLPVICTLLVGSSVQILAF